jgi:transcriptional regulator with XRE-family HTH domain
MTSDEIEKKLEKLISKEKGSWLEDAQYRVDNRKWLKRSQYVALAILTALDKQGLSQKALADRMGISAQQVNKWLKGHENFTFETIAKLEEALNIELMSVVGDDFYKAREKAKVIKKDFVTYSPMTGTTDQGVPINLTQEPYLPLKRSRKKLVEPGKKK